jgi:nifR3 family TIM-barrel protein
MNLLPKDKNQCPFLIVAPMEGVGDRAFRRTITTVGGCDEAVTDFIRVPANAHLESLARHYEASETAPTPLAAQLMGSDPALMGAMAHAIAARGALRIDLNCGCPSNTVTGKGAGSSLLRDPNLLYQNANAMVKAVSVPVTIKMRSGFDDTTLFTENLLAAEESGVKYITLHPRTKAEGYGPPANWALIAKAKEILKIPVVGNGDILNVDDALRMLQMTGCDALMIGRGTLINPFIFHQIRAHFAGTTFTPAEGALMDYLAVYRRQIPESMPEKTKINKMKQLLGFLFKATPQLLTQRQAMLTLACTELNTFMDHAMHLFKQ